MSKHLGNAQQVDKLAMKRTCFSQQGQEVLSKFLFKLILGFWSASQYTEELLTQLASSLEHKS